MKITKQCPECGGSEIYTSEARVGSSAQTLFPEVSALFEEDPRVEVYVCGACGHYQLFIQPRTLEKVKEKYRRYR